jgi:hypothetical protein
MTLEISDLTATSFDTEAAPIEFAVSAPSGLASVPDSISAPITAPKPHMIQRMFVSVGLFLVHLATWTIQLTNWIIKVVLGYASKQKALYQELHQLAKEGNNERIQEFLLKHAHEKSAAGYLFSELVQLPELHSHLAEILQGANICLANDQGSFCRRWSQHADCYRRPSSHQYQEDHCFAIGHFLFWLDLEGNTRFQFENSPLKGLISTINHLIDYLRYRRDNEQQGVTGTSPHTEEYCLKITLKN